jgi:hypothetical protein
MKLSFQFRFKSALKKTIPRAESPNDLIQKTKTQIDS